MEREYDDILKRYVVYKKPLWIKENKPLRSDTPATKKKTNADLQESRTTRADPEVNAKGGLSS